MQHSHRECRTAKQTVAISDSDDSDMGCRGHESNDATDQSKSGDEANDANDAINSDHESNATNDADNRGEHQWR